MDTVIYIYAHSAYLNFLIFHSLAAVEMDGNNVKDKHTPHPNACRIEWQECY
jgi:hypothetical protein